MFFTKITFGFEISVIILQVAGQPHLKLVVIAKLCWVVRVEAIFDQNRLLRSFSLANALARNDDESFIFLNAVALFR